VISEELDREGMPRRSVISFADLARARLQARMIAESGRRAEIHYADNDGSYSFLEAHEPIGG
jgi:hypothetical protein